MSKKRVRYSTEFKLDAVRRMADCESVSGSSEVSLPLAGPNEGRR